MPDQKFIYILWQSQTVCARQKDDLHSVKLVFVPAQKVFDKALNAVKVLGWLKKFGPAQIILGPLKGQGIVCSKPDFCINKTAKRRISVLVYFIFNSTSQPTLLI